MRSVPVLVAMALLIPPSHPARAEEEKDPGIQPWVDEAPPRPKGDAPKGKEEVETGHFDEVARDLSEAVRTLRGQVLVVWILDKSNSMKDDRAALKTRVRRVYDAAMSGEAKLRMAVVGFGQDAKEYQPPTRDVEAVVARVPDIPPDETGVENCMEAILFAAQKYRELPGKKLFVLLTDERGNDADRVEEALKSLSETKARLFCIGTEAPFQSDVAYDMMPGERRLIPIDLGPETPELLSFDYSFYNMESGDIPSGFGNWALARLCKATGGRYYLFRTGTLRDSKAAYDPARLEKDYAPFLGSRAEYEKAALESPALGALRKAVHACGQIRRPDLSARPGEALKPWLETALAQAVSARQVSEAELKALQATEASGRLQADLELSAARLRLWIAELSSLEASVKEILARPLPACEPEQSAHLERSLPATPEIQALMDEARKAYSDLARHHPSTPWEAHAKRILDRARAGGWRLVILEPRKPAPPRPASPPPPRY